jgi:hypothetical protein
MRYRSRRNQAALAIAIAGARPRKPKPKLFDSRDLAVEPSHSKETKPMIHISHGASGDWFIVEPLEGETAQSMAGTPITHEMAVQSLLEGDRTVYALDSLQTWAGFKRLRLDP